MTEVFVNGWIDSQPDDWMAQIHIDASYPFILTLQINMRKWHFFEREIYGPKFLEAYSIAHHPVQEEQD